MHMPEKRSDLVLRCLRKVHVPKQELPVKRPTFTPKWSTKQPAIWFVTRGHEPLQVMTGNQFVMHCGAREVRVVATHAHHFLFMRHRAGWIRNLDNFAAEKERTNKLAFRRQHLHPPRVFRKRWDR